MAVIEADDEDEVILVRVFQQVVASYVGEIYFVIVEIILNA